MSPSPPVRFFYILYRCFLYPLLRTAFAALALFNEKIAKGIQMRAADENGLSPWQFGPSQQDTIWIHCASGEFEYAKPVITEIKHRAPESRILVTYFSPGIVNAVRKFPGVDASCPSPWDHPKALRDLIDHHRPRVLLIARTDTWPEMLRQARLASIPTLLFSATFSPESGRARGLGRWVSRSVFSFLNQIFCVTDEDFKVFHSLGVGDKTRIAGDTRYDQVQARLHAPKPLRAEIFSEMGSPLSKNMLIAGSTWPEDEAILTEVIRLMNSKVRFVLVPHEPSEAHLNELEAKLQSVGVSSVRYTKASNWPADSVLLVDQIGILAELYRNGRFAFVGGSFRKTVHSVMEPLAAGSLTFVGPLHRNNREALAFQKIAISSSPSLHCVEPVSSTQEFVEKLQSALLLPPDVSGKIQSEIAARSGKSALVADWALKHLQ